MAGNESPGSLYFFLPLNVTCHFPHNITLLNTIQRRPIARGSGSRMNSGDGEQTQTLPIF